MARRQQKGIEFEVFEGPAQIRREAPFQVRVWSIVRSTTSQMKTAGRKQNLRKPSRDVAAIAVELVQMRHRSVGRSESMRGAEGGDLTGGKKGSLSPGQQPSPLSQSTEPRSGALEIVGGASTGTAPRGLITPAEATAALRRAIRDRSSSSGRYAKKRLVLCTTQ